jgi:hypothetical protein
MTLMIQSWCPGQGCDPCKPKPEPGSPPSPVGGGLPFFTVAYVVIDQLQPATDLQGNVLNYRLGAMTIGTGGTTQGAFGSPLTFGSPAESSVVSSFVRYVSFIVILVPPYPDGSYDNSLPDITTPVQTSSAADNQAASIVAGNAAIAQANQVLGNP